MSTLKSATMRLKNELLELHRNGNPNYSVGMVGDSLFKWNVSIFGPEGTLYEGGTFNALLIFPESYPIEPPTMKFTTKIYHR